MDIHTKNDGLKSFQEWRELGYKPKRKSHGVNLLINRYSGDFNMYFSENEVEEMTQQEWWDIARIAAKEKERKMEYESERANRLISCGEKEGIKKGKKEQFLRDIRYFGYKIVKVYVNLDHYKEVLYYLVPLKIMPGYIGKFPYGNDIVEGIVVDKNIDVSELERESFFPDGIKKMYE